MQVMLMMKGIMECMNFMTTPLIHGTALTYPHAHTLNISLFFLLSLHSLNHLPYYDSLPLSPLPHTSFPLTSSPLLTFFPSLSPTPPFPTHRVDNPFPSPPPTACYPHITSYISRGDSRQAEKREGVGVGEREGRGKRMRGEGRKFLM